MSSPACSLTCDPTSACTARRSSARSPSRSRSTASRACAPPPTTPRTASPPACGPATCPRAHDVAAQIKAGTVWINCHNAFDTALPFGGYKQSGWGRELGEGAIAEYTQTQGRQYGAVDRNPRRSNENSSSRHSHFTHRTVASHDAATQNRIRPSSPRSLTQTLLVKVEDCHDNRCTRASGPQVRDGEPHRLAGRLGPAAIVFMVVAAAAPLTVVAGTFPIGHRRGQRRRLPGVVYGVHRDL